MRQYIQIPMDFIKSDWWLKDECARTLYIELSQRASYKEVQNLPLGCCYFGRLSFGEKYGYSDSKVRTALSILIKNGAIRMTPAHTKSIVEVLYISEFLKQKNSQLNNQPNDQLNSQPFNQPNDQLNINENQNVMPSLRQPNNQPNSQLFDQPNSQPNDHKHNSITYNSITGIIDGSCENSQPTDQPKKEPPKTLEERQREFYDEVAQYVGKYDREMLRAFYDYWSEPTQNKKNPKMRKDTERTWATGGRLATWYRRQNETQNTNNQQFNNKNYGRNQQTDAERLKVPHIGTFTDEQFDAICEMGRMLSKQNASD